MNLQTLCNEYGTLMSHESFAMNSSKLDHREVYFIALPINVHPTFMNNKEIHEPWHNLSV